MYTNLLIIGQKAFPDLLHPRKNGAGSNLERAGEGRSVRAREREREGGGVGARVDFNYIKGQITLVAV